MKSSRMLFSLFLCICMIGMAAVSCDMSAPSSPSVPSASNLPSPNDTKPDPSYPSPSTAGTEEPSATGSSSIEPSEQVAANPVSFTFTEESMPVIDGSTATIPLITAVQSVLLGSPRMDKAAVSGTDNAYRNLIDGNADVLLVYAPAQSSLDYARDRKVQLEMSPIGKDALVFLINAKNPVQDLTTEQIVGIYSGSITNWKNVGGEDAEIQAYQRQLVSGSQTMMDKLVMKGVPMAKTESEYIISDMGGLVEAVATYNNAEHAIGYNVYYYVSRMKMDENIRLLSVDGVEPTNASIASGEYPFVNDFYAVIRADAPQGSPERILFDWIRSDDGQTLIRHEGYVSARGNR